MRDEAIYATHPNVVAINAGTEAFDADGNSVQINENLVEVEISRMMAERERNRYKELRAAEYPSFADQFDLLYHGGYDAWRAAIQAIKDKYPKP
jgi:hypothetical protein